DNFMRASRQRIENRPNAGEQLRHNRFFVVNRNSYRQTHRRISKPDRNHLGHEIKKVSKRRFTFLVIPCFRADPPRRFYVLALPWKSTIAQSRPSVYGSMA